MTDQITVNVEDLRVALRTHMSSENQKLRAALAEHDKAEQERNDKLVFVRQPTREILPVPGMAQLIRGALSGELSL